MKPLAVILCIASVLLGGCASDPVRYYAYENNEFGMNIAWQQCLSLARSRIKASPCEQTCQANYFGGMNCGPSSGCLLVRAARLIDAKNGRGDEFVVCMADKGFLPCGQGGLHLPECQ